jgi:hypothetical protein
MEIRLTTTKRVYKVRFNKQNQKYILINNKKILLSELKGKYRYIRQHGGTNISYEYTVDGDKVVLNNTNYDADHPF